MIALRYLLLLSVAALSGCSLFSSDEAAPPKKKSWWSLGGRRARDATPFLEYQRVHSEPDKSLVALVVRNTHMTRAIEGNVRTTIETGPNESKMDLMHFTLAPNDSKKLLVFPATTRLTYEVTATFRE